MNRQITLSLILMIVFFAIGKINAQVITVSEEIYLKNDYSYDVLGKLGENVLLFREKGNKFEVHAYDDELRYKWEREIEFEKNRVDIIGMVNEGDSVFSVFYGFRLKGDYILRHKRFNSDISVIDTATIAFYENQYFSPRFLFSKSEDRTKVILFRSDRDSDIELFSYDLIENKVLWDNTLAFKNMYLRRDFREMITTNNGDMFLILERNKMMRKNNYHEIYFVDAGTKELAVKEFGLPELVAIDVEAKFDEMNQNLVLAGLYGEKNTVNAKGLYFLIVDWQTDEPIIEYIDFSDQLVEDVYGKEINKNKGLSDFSVQELVLRQDGGVLLIAEMNKEFSRRPNVPVRRDYGRSGWVDYYYEDLLVFSIHPDGKEHWNTVLHKRQYSQDDEAAFSSFFLFKTPESLRLLYNDEIKQENTVSEYVLKGNGKHERKSVFSTDYQRLRLRFKEGVQVAYNECIVPSERNNRLNLVRIKY